MSANESAGRFGSRPFPRIDWNAPATTVQTTLICCAAALVSCWLTGFVYGISNNQFHLPIIERLYDEPQFADETFVQSLRYYASGFWMLFGWLPKLGDRAEAAFANLFFASRLLSIAGLICCASFLGVTTLRQRAIFTAVVTTTSLLDGNSFAGHGGLFINFFSHSEVANGTTLFALYAALRRRLDIALALAGLTFFLNAFMGIWVMLPLLVMTLAIARDDAALRRRLVVQWLVGGTAFALMAAPIAWNVISNPDLGKPPGFDVAAFLKDWYGDHFLIASNSIHDMIQLACVIVLGWTALAATEARGRHLTLAFAAYVAIYAGGIVAPLVIANPAIFKLCLLRSSAIIQLLSALAASALATKWLCSPRESESNFLGPLLTASLCMTKLVIPLAALIPILARYRPKDFGPALLKPVCIGLAAWGVISQYSYNSSLNRDLLGSVDDWRSVGSWARRSTPADAVFLVPTTDMAGLYGMSEPDLRRYLKMSAATGVFEPVAYRKIWVDFAIGGTALYRPSYFEEWSTRMSAVARLKDLPEKLAYARRNGIAFVIDDCKDFDATGTPAAFRAERLCVARA